MPLSQSMSAALTITLAAAAMVAVLGGCGSRGANVDVAAMRSRIAELEQRVGELERRNMELIGALARGDDEDGEPPAEVRANTPHVAEVSIGRRSHGRDHTGDGRADELVIYLRPKDGRGRFVQMVGAVTVSASAAPQVDDDETAEPDTAAEAGRVIGRRALGPTALRDAYRSGLTGTHYTVTLPLGAETSADHDEAIVRVTYRDGWTGRVHTSERRIELTGPRVQPPGRSS